MTPLFDKKILAVLLEWDYGIRSRGVSCEKAWFFDNLSGLVSHVEPFWYDDYLNRLPDLQKAVLDRADAVRPDLIVFVPYTDQFACETLDRLKDKYATFCWFGDDMWRFENFSVKYAPHFTHVSTTDPFRLSQYESIGIRAILTEWGGQPYSEKIGLLGPGESYAHDVSFVGGSNAYRKWFIRQLSRKGIEVACYGAGWPRGRLSFAEMEQIFRKSRINLNISNSVSHDIRFVLSGVGNLAVYLRSPKRAEAVKARNFEVPFAGGFHLAQYAVGLDRHFDIGKEFAEYTTPEDCALQIAYYLEREDLRNEIARKGHLRALKDHSFRQRIQNILAEIWPQGTGPTVR